MIIPVRLFTTCSYLPAFRANLRDDLRGLFTALLCPEKTPSQEVLEDTLDSNPSDSILIHDSSRVEQYNFVMTLKQLARKNEHACKMQGHIKITRW